MARPIKQGLDYFPLDVGFLQDIKTRKIMRACGIQSIPILISLLSNIYRDEGYYMEWDQDMPFLIADELGVSEGAVLETVTKAVQVDFFNAEIFENRKILTSTGIQERFFKAIERRKEISYDATLMLIEVNSYNNLINVDNNSIDDHNNQQSKEKESKEKESRREEMEAHENVDNFLCTIMLRTGAMFDTIDFTTDQLSQLYSMTPQEINRFDQRLKESMFLKQTKSLDFYLSNWEKIMSGKYADYGYGR